MMLNKELLLLGAEGKKFRGRGWDVTVAVDPYQSLVFGYDSGTFVMGGLGSIQPISTDSPNLNSLFTLGSFSYSDLPNITICREDSGQIIYFLNEDVPFQTFDGTFFTSSDVGKTVRVLILE